MLHFSCCYIVEALPEHLIYCYKVETVERSRMSGICQLCCMLSGKLGLKSSSAHVGPTSMENLFLGANVFMNAFGGHTLSL